MAHAIAIGSQSLLKLEAVENACEFLGADPDISCTWAQSGVNAQPIGLDEIATGAQNRALAARRAAPDAFAIGIENGLIQHNGLWADLACIAVIFPREPERNVTFFWTEILIVPADVVQEVLRRDPKYVTFGQVLSERHPDCEHWDPHSWLSGGRVSRVDLIVDALIHPLYLLFSSAA